MKFPKEVEDLIESAIADGVLTADERAALLKRCLLSGVDPKVLEPELDRRLAEKKKSAPSVPPVPSTQAANSKPAGKVTVHALDDLIKEYLTDGIISEKERAVLLKKAEELGLDKDEMDLYIDAQQQKTDQAMETAANKRRGKTCPYCGGSIPALTDKCPHCGANITPEASDELQEIFDKLEDALVNFKSGEDIEKNKAEVERYVRKAKMYYGNNPKVQKLLAEVESESAAAEENAKKNARNKFLWAHKKLIIWLLIIVIVGIGIGIHYATRTTEAGLIEEVNEKLQKGDIQGADEAYAKANAEDVYAPKAYKAILDAKISKALDESNYDELLSISRGNDSYFENEDIEAKCVKDMVKKDKKDEAVKFIQRICDELSQGGYSQEEVSNRKRELMSFVNQ